VTKKSDKRPKWAYKHHVDVPTRWMDNDTYGHVNNVNYYSYFDTAVNSFLIEGGALDIHNGAVIGLVVETQCKYFGPITFPETVTAGIGVSKIGNSSVRYEIGLFVGEALEPVAQGYFIHVYVDRATRRPTSLQDTLKSLLETILLSD